MKIYETILSQVKKPSRYINGEHNRNNAVEIDTAKIKIVFIFPDLYEIGMSNLGHKILYHFAGTSQGTLVDRCYAVTRDFESLLKQKDIPLTSVEYGIPLNKFDIVAFTLSYELCYTNIISILELGKIPIHVSDRKFADPLVIGGGFCCFNPEPVAEFFDLIGIGEGEEILPDILYRYLNKKNCENRQELLETFSDIEGVYIPAFYKPVDPKTSGTYLEPINKKVPGRIRKRFATNLENGFYPYSIITPSIKTVHDRFVMEVSRGCCGQCRFCQAGNVYLPTRERSVNTILEIIRSNLVNTGYQEVSLAALHAGSYTCMDELCEKLHEEYGNSQVSFSFPSLRPDCLTENIIKLSKTMKKSGFTLAPEAGTERLRNIINKPIDQDVFLKRVNYIFSQGWQLVKLYFMIGLPTERDEDLDAIVTLAYKVLKTGQKFHKHNCSVNVSVSTFVPKPHTPFQWLPMESSQVLRNKQEYLRKKLRHPGIKFKWHSIGQSILEELFSRGDRSLSNLLMEAYKRGCRLDAWTDEFRWETWQDTMERSGTSSIFTTIPDIPETLPLPWDHINCGINKPFLLSGYQDSLKGLGQERCNRTVCSSYRVQCPGKVVKNTTKCLQSFNADLHPKKLSRSLHNTNSIAVRCKFQKKGRFRFLSHLETRRWILMAFNRASIPLKYSQGFNPKPRVSFYHPLPVGTESLEEWIELILRFKVAEKELLQKINLQLPQELHFQDANYLEPGEQNLLSLFTSTKYDVTILTKNLDHNLAWKDVQGLKTELEKFLNSESIIICKNRDGQLKTMDAKQVLLDIQVKIFSSEKVVFQVEINLNTPGSLRPEEILANFLGLEHENLWKLRVCRKGFF